MLAMKLRFCVYLVIFVALLVMLVLDPHMLARSLSLIAAAFASLAVALRAALAGLN